MLGLVVLQMSMSGWCANSTLLDNGASTFAYDWCPYKYAWLCVLGLALYLLCFSPGEEPQAVTGKMKIMGRFNRTLNMGYIDTLKWVKGINKGD